MHATIDSMMQHAFIISLHACLYYASAHALYGVQAEGILLST